MRVSPESIQRPQESATKSWVRALERTADIPNRPRRTLAAIIEELGERLGEAPALLSEELSWSYRSLAAQSNRYARWALAQGLIRGDRICLLMANQPDFVAAWLGFSRVGVVSALLNTNLSGPALAHCISL